MLGRIEEIIDNSVIINLSININEQPNLVNLHVIFEDGSAKKVVAEIANVNQTKMIVNVVGEINNNIFTPGANSKPSFKSNVRIIDMEELELLFGKQKTEFGQTNFGTSNVYEGYKINVNVNDFFSNHYAILGNSGAGKSCTVASILQKLFTSSPKPPVNSSLFFFDAYGEYSHAFYNLHEKNPKLSYKAYTTNIIDPDCDILRIPIWLLDVDDLALLLDATSPSQLPIIEKTLKLVPILTGSSEAVIKRKNDIIARALQDILLSGSDSTKIRDQVIGVLTKFNTPTLNLESQIVQPGYIRTLKQCLYVDKTGKMQEMELVVEFTRAYIIEEQLEIDKSEMNPFYTLTDLELAMEFALISEGILKSDKVFDNANVISVRLHSLATSDNRHYFNYPKYVTRDQFIETLLWNQKTNSKAQIVNFNINYIDDRLAKVITKILSRMLFLKASTTKPRGSRAYHIIIEEAHRYVQHDSDVELLGYNIFERITKEGRKYGMFLALITQRPSELSDTCISQCANFVILRTLHPVDLKYIKEMVPNVSQEIVLQLKNLKPGNCIAFGTAFKVPTSMYIDIPNPRPLSNNVNLEAVWYELNNSGLNNGVVQQMTSNSPDSVSTIMAQQVNKANNLNMQTLSSTQQPVIQKPIQQPVQQPVPQNIQAPLPVQPQALKEITN
ncbi:MAG: ATP-binding protein [Bacilli bacterium]|nr:ATP-binding protein [Bacilli bacterium]